MTSEHQQNDIAIARDTLDHLRPEHKAGMRDFWQVYRANYATVQQSAFEFAFQDPLLSDFLRKMSLGDLAHRQADSLERLEAAILKGGWTPYFDDLV